MMLLNFCCIEPPLLLPFSRCDVISHSATSAGRRCQRRSLSVTLGGIMKSRKFTTYLALGVIFSLYVGSYFLCVSQVGFGFTRGDQVAVAPGYRYIPGWLDAPRLYRPIHLLDEKYLHRSKWQTRPARDGELNGPSSFDLNAVAKWVHGLHAEVRSAHCGHLRDI